MRHRKKGTRLGRKTAHVKALKTNLVISLIEHGRIVTTLAKAKEIQPIADKMITLGKKGELHHRRQAMKALNNKQAVHKLFEEISKQYTERPGGYTRVLKMGKNRLGDNGQRALIEFVEGAAVAKSDAPAAEETATA